MLLVIFNRISNYSTICRFEQGPSCIQTFNNTATTSVASFYTLPFYFIIQIMVWLAFRHLIRENIELNNNGKSILYVLFPTMLLQCVLYSIFDTLEGHVIGGSIIGVMKLISARLFAVVFLIGILFCLYPIGKSSRGITSPSTILYFCMISVIYTVLLITQKPMGGITLGLGYIKTILLLETKSRYNWIIFYLLGLHLFFVTGHQTTFPSLQMEVGFIGIRNVNWVLTPLYIFLNTFGGFLIGLFGYSIYIKIHGGDFVAFRNLAVASCFSTVLFCAHFKHHLMVWSVFAPRMCFATVWCCLIWAASYIL